MLSDQRTLVSWISGRVLELRICVEYARCPELIFTRFVFSGKFLIFTKFRMILDGADDMFELLKGALPYYVIVFVPILIVISPMTPVLGAHEFTVYRMQQFDLQGTSHGCRNSIVNLEARTLPTQNYLRRCIITYINDLTYTQYQDIILQGAGGLLVLIPANFNSLTEEEQQRIMELEKSMLEDEVNIPVYFALETPEIREIYKSIEKTSGSDKSGSAAEEILRSVTASGFQMSVTSPQAQVQKDIQIVNIQGKLSGFGVEEQLPTITIAAHYDSFGVAPALAYGADSNGSGVAALLELARLLSRLYTSSRTHPRFNILFLISGGGKFNYHGTKKWIEDNLDNSDGSLLPDSLYTLCLDTLGSSNNLYLHVSKPPKEGSAGALFFRELQNVARELYPEMNVTMIHKKINLAEETLAWEHERFSIRRLPSFTLSHLQSPRALKRNTILDVREKVDVNKLARNVKVLAEALARHVYNTGEHSGGEIFTDGLSVQPMYISSWIDHLSSQPRPAQLLAHPHHPLIHTLEHAISPYLKEVRLSIFKPDKRDPEVVFFEPVTVVMSAYNVKPAIFDLFLALGIACYLGIVYLFITNFYRLEALMRHFNGQKVKQT